MLSTANSLVSALHSYAKVYGKLVTSNRVKGKIERLEQKLDNLDLRTKGAKIKKAELEAKLDTLRSSLPAAYLEDANTALIQSDYAGFAAIMHHMYRFGAVSSQQSLSSTRDTLITIAAENLSIWWNIWRLLLSSVGAKSIEELTEAQFNSICDRLNITCSALKSKAIFVTWILSNGKDNIKFPMKPKFNAVRQDYMLTPRVSFSQLAACKLFEKYSKDELFDQLFKIKCKKGKEGNQP